MEIGRSATPRSDVTSDIAMAKLSMLETRRDLDPRSFEIAIDRAAQDARNLGYADEGLAYEIARIEGLGYRESMIPREDGDQRLPQNQLEREIRVRFVSQEGDVDPPLLQVLGERDRKTAGHPDLDLGQFVAENPGRGRKPGGFLSRQKADGENRLGGTRGAARCLGGRFSLRQRQARVIEKGAAGGRQFDAAHAAGEKRGADFLLEVPHLAAEGGLRRMQAAFRCELHAPRLGDCDEIAKMPELHALGSIASEAYP